MKTAFSILFLLCAADIVFCQVQAPQIQGFQSVNISRASQPSLVSGNNNSVMPAYGSNGEFQTGSAPQDIRTGQNAGANTVLYQKRLEVEQIIKDIQTVPKKSMVANSGTITGTSIFKRFDDALKHLDDMLAGRAELSVADAYYTIESAFGNPYLSREQYHNIIKESVDFIKRWMLENRLDPKDNYSVQYAIQKFMSETLTINNTTQNGEKGASFKPVTHQPFHYDFDDYQGAKDYRNMFVTKCLATGFGQCNSMPIIYLVLAESLGVKAYLSFAPHHSLIKYPDNKGDIINYEPTSNWEISDTWYKDNLFISAKAIETGIYLDTFNRRQVVANCIFDLAVNYMIADGTGNEDFIIKCIRYGTPHFPKNNNLQSLFIYSVHLKTMLQKTMSKYGIARIEDIDRVPEAKKLYREYMGNEVYIDRLGYSDMPAGMYEAMLNQQEFKGKVQQQYKINGKEQRNLFSKK